MSTKTALESAKNPRTAPMFISGTSDYLQAVTAMRAHQSQLVWFRWMYIMFSRYMWVNEWTEVRLQ
jgi:N-acetylglucosaminylphosphatidylinositol deacetylase